MRALARSYYVPRELRPSGPSILRSTTGTSRKPPTNVSSHITNLGIKKRKKRNSPHLNIPNCVRFPVFLHAKRHPSRTCRCYSFVHCGCCTSSNFNRGTTSVSFQDFLSVSMSSSWMRHNYSRHFQQSQGWCPCHLPHMRWRYFLC